MDKVQSFFAALLLLGLAGSSAFAAPGATAAPAKGNPTAHQAAPPEATAAPTSASTPVPTAARTSVSTAAPTPVFPLTSDQVAGHMGETVDWFHHLAPIEQLQVATLDSSGRNKLHQQALTAAQLAIAFGKASAVLLDAQTRGETNTEASPAPDASKGASGRLDKAAEDVAQRIATLQAQSASLDQQIAHARGVEHETLTAQQGQVNAALRLAREVQSSVQTMEDFEASSIAGDKGNLSPLDGQIVDIERSVPELAEAASKGSLAKASAGSGTPSTTAGAVGASSTAAGSGAAANAGTSARSSTFRAESAGVVALVTEWFSLNDMRRQLDDAIKETSDLREELERVRTKLTTEVRKIVGDGLAISTSTDPAQLLAQRQQLEAGTARFKQLATVLIPIGEQALVVENAAGALDDWRESIDGRMASIARYIALRIGIMLAWVAAVLIISDIWRRATFRYLHDLRRRRQFLVLRRVAVGAALVLVIVFGLVSEIGSITTYIGFVTAGIAVALQNVILAVVAYFFLIGRYGVRVGDRITLAGVTGRVVDIGLVRIYLMELSGADLHATGRMVVLSNAVLFQPTAMFKQIPGADYVWHTVTLTIAATADVLEAHKRLKVASEEVYDKYRDAIERQHAMVQRFLDFDASSPQPEIRVRLTENGLECSVRYPVELENAAVIDQQMLKALRDALEQDAQFKLVASGAVMLRSSD